MDKSNPWPISLEDSLKDLVFLLNTGQRVVHEPFRPYDAPRNGQLVFIRMLLTTRSIIRLLEVGPEEKGIDRRVVDPFSIASLVRDLVEAHDALRYLYLERVSENEAEFRVGLYGHHQNCEKAKMRNLLRLPEKEGAKSPLGDDWVEAVVRGFLERREVFRALTPRQQKELLKGRSPYYRTEHVDFDSILAHPTFSRGMYKLLSNIVHAHPMANSMLQNLPWTQWPDYEDLLDLSIGYGTLHLAEGVRGMIARRRLGVKFGTHSGNRIRKIIRAYSAVFTPLIKEEAILSTEDDASGD